jgi:hypothetical protein
MAETTMNTGQWGELLIEFKNLIKGDPSPESIRGPLEALKEKASNSHELTIHQKGGIIARCDNHLKGEYGNTKTQENLDYQHKGAK